MNKVIDYTERYNTLVEILDNALLEILRKIPLGNQVMKEFGESSREFKNHETHPKTAEGEEYFARLEYKVARAKISILFPWTDSRKEGYTLKLYSSQEVPSDRLERFLGKLIAKTEEYLGIINKSNKNYFI